MKFLSLVTVFLVSLSSAYAAHNKCKSFAAVQMKKLIASQLSGSLEFKFKNQTHVNGWSSKKTIYRFKVRVVQNDSNIKKFGCRMTTIEDDQGQCNTGTFNYHYPVCEPLQENSYAPEQYQPQYQAPTNGVS